MVTFLVCGDDEQGPQGFPGVLKEGTMEYAGSIVAPVTDASCHQYLLLDRGIAPGARRVISPTYLYGCCLDLFTTKTCHCNPSNAVAQPKLGTITIRVQGLWAECQGVATG